MGRRGNKGGGSSSNNATELKSFLKNRMWRDHSKVIIAVIVIIIAVFSSIILQFTRQERRVTVIEPMNTVQTTKVFKSGEPWVILCTDPDKILPNVFEKATKKLLKRVNVGVMDCHKTFPSGKTVLERFHIKSNIEPTIFTVANGNKPQQIFLNYLQSSKAFSKHVFETTKKTMSELLTTEHLETKCLHKKDCVLLLRLKKWQPFEKKWLDQLMAENRKTTFVWMDTKRFLLTKLTDGLKKNQHNMIVFQNKKQEVYMQHYTSHFDYIPIGQFLQQKGPFQVMKEKPKIIKKTLKPKSYKPPVTKPTTTKEDKEDPKPKQKEYKAQDYYPQDISEHSNIKPMEEEVEEEEVDLLDDE